EQQTRSGIASHVNVRPAVIVEVAGDGGEPIAIPGGGNSGLHAHVGKCSISFITVETMPAIGKAARATGYGGIEPAAVRILAGPGSFLQIKLKIVGDEQIKVPVAVLVEEGASRAPAPGRVGQSGGAGHIREGAVAVVAVEDVLSPAGDEEVLEAIIVIVTDADNAGPACFPQPRTLGYVGESAVAVVLEEPVAGARGGVLQASAGEQKNIQPAVIIEVEECAAAAESFDNVFLAITFAINRDSSQASLGGHICEGRSEGKAGRFAPGLRRGLVGRNALAQARGRGRAEQSGEKDPSRGRH